MKYFIYSIFILLITACSSGQKTSCDVLVVGASTSGTAAAIQSARMGADVVLVEPTPWVGGMLTAAGVSAVDGNYRLRAGIWGEFLMKLSAYYGGDENLVTGWVSNVQFEPSVGQQILRQMCDEQPTLNLMLNTNVESISKVADGWTVELVDEQGKKRTIHAKVMIDATELGDIAKAAGAGYDIGMESRNDTGEEIAPEIANGIIQDLTYAAVLKDYGKDVTIPMPEGYDPDIFACCAINELCVSPKEPDRMWSPEMMISYGQLPNGKYMINWPIEGNDYYGDLIECTPAERDSLEAEAKHHTLCFVYFLQTALGFNNLGLADDEFPTDDLLPLIPYHRESRRVHGEVRFTFNHIEKPYEQPQALYRTNIAVGDYPVDQHHARYHGYDDLPNLYFHPIPSFGLPMGVLLPKDVDNLIVAEKSISVSNIANGATRLQPVVLQIGQASGVIAALAAKQGCQPRDVDVRKVQKTILDAGGYLMPFLDALPTDVRFKPYQRIGVCGLLQGEGRNVEWSNQTWLRASDPLLKSDLAPLYEMYGCAPIEGKDTDKVTVEELKPVLQAILEAAPQQDEEIELDKRLPMIAAAYGFKVNDPDRVLLRGEYAIILDRLLDPFSKPVSLDGSY